MSVQKDLILDFDNFLLDIQSCNLNNRRDFYEKNTVLQQKLALIQEQLQTVSKRVDDLFWVLKKQSD